jgi:hypothetical protein
MLKSQKGRVVYLERGNIKYLMFRETNIYTSNFPWYDRNKPARSNAGLLIEEYIANGMSLYEIAQKYKVNYEYASRIISLYFKKPPESIILQSKV